MRLIFIIPQPSKRNLHCKPWWKKKNHYHLILLYQRDLQKNIPNVLCLALPRWSPPYWRYKVGMGWPSPNGCLEAQNQERGVGNPEKKTTTSALNKCIGGYQAKTKCYWKSSPKPLSWFLARLAGPGCPSKILCFFVKLWFWSRQPLLVKMWGLDIFCSFYFRKKGCNSWISLVVTSQPKLTKNH